MKTYTIRAGSSFVSTDKDGKPVTLTGGQQIELEDDVAAAHARLLEPVVQAPAQDTAAAADGAA